ncbi:hypothetical protein CTEN210_14699 [Chaetoceros tenuissimus]|uniref:dUTP diphosphatase n=2 Tax=Chaetoceros tenuissimus TaxID=426638 RepID=A0AAD3D5L7_9STRA|nr:hypothetical protein CTEN210_14699 [Chaetoceros tenuissimus]
MIAETKQFMQSLENTIHKTEVCTHTYWNTNSDEEQRKMKEDRQRELKERFRQSFARVSRKTKTDSLVDYLVNKVTKTTASHDPTQDVANELPEMEWIKTKHGYIDPTEIDYAEPTPFPVHEFYRDQGYKIHIVQNLEKIQNDFADILSIASDETEPTSNCRDDDSVSSCGSICSLGDNDGVLIEGLPHDISSKLQEHKIDMEQIFPSCHKLAMKTHSGILVDQGANTSITPHLNQLQQVQDIDDLSIGSASKDEDTLIATRVGQLPLVTGDVYLPIHALFSAQASETIIAPTAICRQYGFKGFTLWTSVEKGTGKLIFDTGGEPLEFNMVIDNDLWYLSEGFDMRDNASSSHTPFVNKLSTAQSYELWHQRLGHCGSKTLQSLHKHAEGVPKLKGTPFYRCPSCMHHKLATKQPMGKETQILGSKSSVSSTSTKPPEEEIMDDLHLPEAQPGQHFAMDYGFMRGSDYDSKTEEGKLVTSIDDKRCYCLIVDRKTRYMWVILSPDKEPPIKAIRSLLLKFKSDSPHRTVRLDQDRALGKSSAFLKMLEEDDINFLPEFTGTNASAQNGLAERPHRTLADMVRCMLHSADMGSEMWSFALTHAVWIRNRITHWSITKTPYEALTGVKPNLSRARIFGSKVFARKTKQTGKKLDNKVVSGRFLGFTASPKVMYFLEDSTNKVRTGTHVIFDEAHMTTISSNAPMAAQALQRLGYTSRERYKFEGEISTDEDLQVQLLSETSVIPARGTEDSIGYDICSNAKLTLFPNKMTIVPTGIACTAPSGTYLRIAPRSGTTVKQHLDVLAGVIDRDYTGEIAVVMYNFGEEAQEIEVGQRVAQMIIERANTAPVIIVDNLVSTQRGNKGFGSTDNKQESSSSSPPQHQYFTRSKVVTDDEGSDSDDSDDDSISPTVSKVDIVNSALEDITLDLNIALDMPYDLHMSSNPFDAFDTRAVTLFGNDPLLGFVLEDHDTHQCPRLLDCTPSTPAAKLIRWRSELRGSHITHINGLQITSIADVKRLIAKARQYSQDRIKVRFAINHRKGIKADTGMPQLFQDQMNVIGKHLWELQNSPEWQEDKVHLADSNSIVNHKINAVMRDYKYSTAELLIPSHEEYPSAIEFIQTRTVSNANNSSSVSSLLANVAKKVQSKKRKKKKTIKDQNKLTRKSIRTRDDFHLFLESEKKQLDQYYAQETFGPPQALPPNANLLTLFWVYVLKDVGTRKARCVCNGARNMRGSVTLAETYASALNQDGSRLFWSKAALDNFIVVGADASNAFAEAPAPVAPLYVKVDEQYRHWYSQKFPEAPPIPANSVLRVKKALQGHPESPRLWAKLIDGIIRQLNLKPCTHEPCLYYTNDYNNTGKTVIFLRQVDDFAVACETKDIATQVISDINSKMSIDVKELGVISRYNGVDVSQTRHYIKLSNCTYIDKISKNHPWMLMEKPAGEFPIPMRDDTEYQKQLEDAEPLTPHELETLQESLGFTYRQGIGELIYALVTCRPDISYAITKLSQYSDKPAAIHFEALKKVYLYLVATKHDGIYYWRTKPRLDFPLGETPRQKLSNNFTFDEYSELQQPATTLHATVDSNHASDVSHRRSVSGICIKLAGGAVLYKTLIQKQVSLSSTEAEFYAAVSAGKYILYLRTILQELGLPQYAATTLYEDNMGCMLMAQAGKPTNRTRHLDIRMFALQDWVENDLIAMKRIPTEANTSDAFTKATGRSLFYRHMDFAMGRIIPTYAIPHINRIHTDAQMITSLFKEKLGLQDFHSFQCYDHFSRGGYYTVLHTSIGDTSW